MTEQLLRVPQVAQRLAISNGSVYRLLHSGDLKCVLVGKSRRVKVSDLDAYIEQISQAA